MNKNDFIKLVIVTSISILFGALTIAAVYFITSQRAPSAPVSKPQAAGGLCYLEFFFPSPTPTGTPGPTSTPTPTGTPGPTSTPTPTSTTGCYSTCTSDSNCEGDLVCQSISGINRCVNSSCPYNSNCTCTSSPTYTPTPTPTPKTYVPVATPTEVVLLQAGVSTPAWTAALGGAFLVLLGVLFFAL